ncbi:PTS system, glucose subfamily, IIA component [Actinomyces viscosus C505]|uniref:PTS system, glucose subfamily, IIA component n=1 Tax=Actinomyces viscosus C505 TaxID=562973 RepID=F2UZP7_ACTVI|nr:glucose PTS transporter subunit IIA [Actinomyces viscosus]EGE37651.1 PTS system, glucose subfamily, IIA component [Actinomyces viscosus C505]PKY84441.1 PTS beta-glucoside transporter subunit EIIBCA [Actinomyces naeslundii]
MATTTSTPEAILDAVGGAENIIHFTHCATRLRFELKDASGIDKAAVEAIPGVMGAVPQSGDRYQIVIGGAVQSVYDEINSLPAMKSQGGSSGSGQSDADVKAAARAKARGKNAYVDAFFEYLSDSFRPLLPALLGASLIIAGEAICEAFGLIDTHVPNDQKPTTLLFVDAMFRAVFYFLPVMVAYNASKKLKIDPWVGTAIMAALLTPEYIFLSDKALQEKGVIDCVHNASVNSDLCTAHIAGLPMQLNNYGGQVFVPLMMVAILALVYKGLVKVVPSNVQMVFVPFLSFVIMMPVTAFLIGPLGVWIGTGLGTALFWLNSHAPIIFAILIPMVYPFLVPLGLHWPLNALMLANIASAATNHTDFIQGPMGAWNFACFGATAAVLVWSVRDKDNEMRQTATGALFAGLLGGISEPSLYGIHLRFKRIYPFMLVGCAVGGLVQGIGSMLGGIEGVTTTTFAFTSLLTIPVFNPMWLYGISVAAAFATSFFLIVTFGYRTKEERAEALAAAGASKGDSTIASAPAETAETPKAGAAAAAAPVEEGDRTAKAPTPKPALVPGAVTEIASPLKATTMDLDKVPDPVFSSGAVGQGVGLEPQGDIVVTAPADGTVVVAPSSGHAFGITLDSGVEILIHVGLDTVNLEGQGFDVKVSQGDRVSAGQELVRVDRSVIEQAGYPLTTPVLVTNTASFASVEVVGGDSVEPGEALIKVTAPEA